MSRTSDEPVVSLGDWWGPLVAKRREQLGLTQQELAELCSVTQQTVSKIERGQIVPRDNLKRTLSLKLATPIDQLFPWPRAS